MQPPRLALAGLVWLYAIDEELANMDRVNVRGRRLIDQSEIKWAR